MSSHAQDRSSGRIGLLETMAAPGGRAQDTPVTRLEQDLVKERFYRLLEIYRRINSELDRERLLGLVMDTAVELTGAERGFLLLGDTPDAIKVEVARNLVFEGEEGEYSRSIAERGYRSGRPASISSTLRVIERSLRSRVSGSAQLTVKVKLSEPSWASLSQSMSSWW